MHNGVLPPYIMAMNQNHQHTSQAYKSQKLSAALELFVGD